LGHDIYVGDKVVWLSGMGKYGGVKIFVVRRITAKRVAISEVEQFKKYPGSNPSYAAHDVVIVVNKLINDPMERDE